jgi:hypothetical protein
LQMSKNKHRKNECGGKKPEIKKVDVHNPIVERCRT